MKLFKKLFLQIFLAFLVLSQAVFFYLLYESRRQAVESIQHYEKLSFQGKTGELDQKLRGMYETEEQEIQDRIVASAFRQYVGSQGILYRGTSVYFFNLHNFTFVNVLLKNVLIFFCIYSC